MSGWLRARVLLGGKSSRCCCCWCGGGGRVCSPEHLPSLDRGFTVSWQTARANTLTTLPTNHCLTLTLTTRQHCSELQDQDFRPESNSKNAIDKNRTCFRQFRLRCRLVRWEKQNYGNKKTVISRLSMSSPGSPPTVLRPPRTRFDLKGHQEHIDGSDLLQGITKRLRSVQWKSNF